MTKIIFYVDPDGSDARWKETKLTVVPPIGTTVWFDRRDMVYATVFGAFEYHDAYDVLELGLGFEDSLEGPEIWVKKMLKVLEGNEWTRDLDKLLETLK